MIHAPNFSFTLNPKCASTSIVIAMIQNDLRVVGERHKVTRTDSKIRAVVQRDDDERMRSGWRAWGNGETFSAWLDGPPCFASEGVDFKTTPQTYWTDNATHVLRFSHLATDWAGFCEVVGLKITSLEHANRTLQHA